MDISNALGSLSALAHAGRLSVFRLLVKAGPAGLAAGEIARKLRTQANTMSAQLLVLSNAGLIRARRDGRSIIYAAKFEHMNTLIAFLTENCCGGVPCTPAAACKPARKRIKVPA